MTDLATVGRDEIRALEDNYRSGKQDLRRDFFARCFKYCSHYRRASGYFASTALVSWLAGLTRVVHDGAVLPIELIVSHELSPEDAQALRNCHDPEEKRRLLELATDKVVDLLVALGEEATDVKERVALFAWLVAQGHIQLRFAFPSHVDDVGIFHEKIGIFDFPWGDRVAFTGSANETLSGHTKNFESVDVFRSWVPGDQNRVSTKSLQFNEAWKNEAEGLEVVPLSDKALRRIKEVARSPKRQAKPLPPPSPSKNWEHQDEAIARFLAAKRGILEMATGTGKTRTALRILSKLLEAGAIEGAIVTTDGTDLLNQWCGELDTWLVAQKKPLAIYRHFDQYHDIGKFVLAAEGAVLVVSRSALPLVMKRLTSQARAKLAVIHDEVHGLGMPSIREGLKGQHATFPYVLGLSATPERSYDAEGNSFIEVEIGKSIFRFPIEAAIARGILCQFDYEPLPYELTENDRQRLQQVYAKQVARTHSGNPMSQEEIWIEISKIYKTAEMKPEVFTRYLSKNAPALKRSIIFVETKEYGERVLDIIHNYTNLYRTYYAEDDTENLVRFSQGETDCLITCHKISQGIDIQSLRTVFLFSSARSKLETVQRIGRCLRVDPHDPEKRALVVDFVRPQEEATDKMNADTERCRWLTAISMVRKGDNSAHQ